MPIHKRRRQNAATTMEKTYLFDFGLLQGITKGQFFFSRIGRGALDWVGGFLLVLSFRLGRFHLDKEIPEGFLTLQDGWRCRRLFLLFGATSSRHFLYRVFLSLPTLETENNNAKSYERVVVPQSSMDQCALHFSLLHSLSSQLAIFASQFSSTILLLLCQTMQTNQKIWRDFLLASIINL